MCGINGLRGSAEAAVAEMNKKTEHRGPDQTGVAAAESWTVGNNRLSIIDLTEAGRQPITSADGRYTIVFNGEIYNYRELRAALAADGVAWRGGSDTEVVLEGYAKDGRAFLGRLRGMYALAIRDNQSGELFLARDPFGIKPLYFYDDGKTAAFSSELKGLLALPQVSRELDPAAILDILLLGFVVAPRTILKNVRVLLPGEEIAIPASGASVRSLRRLRVESHAAPTDAELFAGLEDSVCHHLIADVPVGLFFSGGIDSTALAIILSKIGAGLTAYHVSIEGRDDSIFARRIADKLGLNFIEIPFSPERAAALLQKFWSAMDQPFADVSFLPTLAVSERAAADVKVALSGEGGDELFAGYARHRRLAGLGADFARSSRSAGFFRSLFGRAPGQISRLASARGAIRSLAALSRDPIGTYLGEIGIGSGLAPEFATRQAIKERLTGRELDDWPLSLDRLVYLPDDLLAKIDVASMAFSLEGRVPFLDREIFALVGGAPFDWKRNGDESKAPLRRLLRQNLPSDLVDRPKTGFSLPLGKYIFEFERENVKEALAWYLDNYSGLAPALDSVFRAWRRGKIPFEVLEKNLGYVLFAVLTLRKFTAKL